MDVGSCHFAHSHVLEPFFYIYLAWKIAKKKSPNRKIKHKSKNQHIPEVYTKNAFKHFKMVKISFTTLFKKRFLINCQQKM